MGHILRIICRKNNRKLLVVFSLLMYVGSAHGMIFLMDMSKDTHQQHAMHTNDKMVHDVVSDTNMDSHFNHTKAHISTDTAPTHDHDMQSCLDHCLASVTISYSLSNFILPKDQSTLITSFNVNFHSLLADITSPPPKSKLL